MSGSKTKGQELKAVTVKRDDFSLKTIQRLRDSVGNVCAFPGCSVNTHGANASGDGVVNLGVACHIKAAAPLGPRYDPEQTSDDRKHFDNGIWMCQTHSRLIDADKDNYSVDELWQWKREAEIKANAQLNQKSFTEKELKSALNQGSAELLQRFVNMSGDPINAPIPEVIKGYEASLESLDPRFRVEVNKSGGHYQYFIQPVGDEVNLQLIIEGTDKIEGYLAAEKALLEEGRELVIPSDHFRLEGSELIEQLHEKARGTQKGTLTMGAPKRELAGTLYVRTEEGSEKIVDTFTFYYTSGTLRTVFDGKALEGLVAIRAHCSHDGQDTKFDISISLDAWRGKDILEFPRFSRLLKAAELLSTGRLVFELEIKNQLVPYDSRSAEGSEEFHSRIDWIIHYLELARKVAVNCDAPVVMLNTEMSPDTYSILRKYNKLIEGAVISPRDSKMLCKGEFDYTEGCTFESLEKQGAFSALRISEPAGVKFDLFGQSIEAPRLSHIFTNVEYVFYTDLEAKGQPKFEVYTTEDSTITTLLHPDDSWSVGEALTETPEAFDHGG
ncbi:MAG: hypothetical protein P0Y58_04960 [Candidatus Pseudomonas phytovorans]|uniref:HNH endonuclease n=1 Tax=Candidatus Pseudomonas phytovorans TaxID=3121377 RepID=A0AAJ6BBJ0_9PSED|nr:hypothetical protein [Pseudomonas sp.]WEK31550.1 MAG: hypothetical protein P0Y58_04960 [Pseudomonas sp.]